MAKMSKGKRDSLPSSSFAGPGRSFPVNDRAHAKAAIMDSKYAPNPAAVRAKAEAALHRMPGAHSSFHHGKDINMKDHR